MERENRAIVLRAERAAAGGGAERPRWPRLEIEPRPLGSLAPGTLRVRMLLVGLCGTDLHLVRADPETGAIAGSAPLEIGGEGRVLGHEGVGQVCAVGAGVRGIALGDVVTFESLLACQRCDACRRGRFNQCREGRLMGAQVDGLFRSVVDVPATTAHDVSDLARTPEGLLASACTEPAACAYVALSRLALRPGERAVVFGAGPIGLFSAMLCREAFGARVEVVEPLPGRRAAAAPWAERARGVDEFFAAEGDEPFDAAIEASGDLDNVRRVVPRLRAAARVGLLARRGRPLVVEDVDHLITNGISIVGSRGHLGGGVADVLALVRAGRLPLHRCVTGVVDGLDGLRREMLASDPVERRHAKVLARLGELA